MNVHLPISLFFILQLFTSTVWSQRATFPSTFPDSTSTSSITSANGTQSVTGTANSTTLSVSATATSTAQYPSLSGVSSCVSGCLAEGSARLNCTSVVDVNCYCVNSHYPAEIVACVLANCPSEVTTVETLGQQFCNIASAHPTLSFPPSPATSSTSSTSSSSIPTTTSTVTSTPTTTSTNSAASSWKSMHSSTALMGLGVLWVLRIVLGV